MAKDFYKMEADGTMLHEVVMGMNRYKEYRAAGWSNIKPKVPSVIPAVIDPFEGMDEDPEMKDIFNQIKANKKPEVAKGRPGRKAKAA